ncbi:unnamed protein product, partial [Lymnaea stagnalis]
CQSIKPSNNCGLQQTVHFSVRLSGKSAFRRTKASVVCFDTRLSAMSLLYDKVVNIINKSPADRQDGEIEQILPWFRKKSDLFKSLHTDIVKDIVKNCKFSPTKRDSVIIRQMDKGDCFYIILSGSVAIHINTTLTEEEYPAVKEGQMIEEALVEKEALLGRPLDRSKYGIYVGKIGNHVVHFK